MKKLTVFCFLVGFCTTAFCQQKTFSPTKDDYLQKSKQQKKTAKILLGVGGIVWFTGAILAIDDLGKILSDEPSTNGTIQGILLTTGWAAALASIPFYIASSKNKKKAAALTLKSQKVPTPFNSNFVCKTVPAISIRLSL